jgi:hypothetical protein
MSHLSVQVCSGPVDSEWQVGSDSNLLLIGWTSAPASVDAGVPLPVQSLLAAAMVEIVQVAYLDLPRADQKQVVRLAPAVMLRRWAARLKGFPGDAAFIVTRDAGAATRMFDADGFDWVRQQQVVILLEEQAEAPSFSIDDLQLLTGDDWCGAARRFMAQGVVGVLRPGVDGDVAALCPLHPELARSFREAMARHASRLGIDLCECTEDQMAHVLGS